jgi:endoglucanase
VQLRGVNMSGLELSSILGSGDPWGYSGFGTSSGKIPDDRFIRAQKCNVVRLPLNEESWLGYANSAGTNPDPSGNYVAVVEKSVAQYTADGLYVILDLHWSSTGASVIANSQQEMADSAHSLTFWTSVANAFKNNPAVIFELYNEPHDISNAIVSGGGSGWAGYQQMLNAVRATGATNVVLMGGTAWSNDETWWTSNRPVDTLNQIAAAHHDYDQGLRYDIGTNPTAATAMLNAPGVPVVITEIGDSNSGSSYISAVLNTADAQGYGVVAWALNPADSFGAPNLLQSFTPPTAATTTSGAYYFNWTLSHP